MFVEEKIIEAVKRLLSEQVNELLIELEFSIPLIEFSGYEGGDVVVPVISLMNCERSEKERLIRLDSYSLVITFSIPETEMSESYCYAYSAAVQKAFRENPTLDGIIDRITLTGKKYTPPKKPYCGERREVTLTFRLTVEGDT